MKLLLAIAPSLLTFAFLTACDEDPADTGATDTAQSDTPEPDTVDETRETTGATDTADGSSTADAADSVDDGDTGPTDPPTCAPDQLTLLTPEPVACDPNRGFCREGACLDDETVCDYEWGDRLTILHIFRMGDQSDEVDPATGAPLDNCCYDLVGDAVLDNALGRGFRNLKGVGLDLNAEFADQIRRARMNYVFDFFDLDDLVNDPHVEFVGYETVHDEAEGNPEIPSGFASFEMRDRSFFLPSRLPRIGAIGTITNGKFVAPTGRFSYILSTVEEGLAEIPIRLARFEFDVALGPNGRGLALTNGRLGGVAAVVDFFGALNAEVVEACNCREFVGGFGPLDSDTRTCRPPTRSDCDEEAALCVLLTDRTFCQFFADSFVPDYDLDGDGTLDGLTTGTSYEGTSAEVEGWYDQCPRP